MAESQPMLEPGVGDDSEETLPDLFNAETSAKNEEEMDLPAFEREVPHGRPVCAVPVSSIAGLAAGDHVVLVTSHEPYRPSYQSGLVVETRKKGGKMLLVRNRREGVLKEWVPFDSFSQVHIVLYTMCRYSSEEAIQRAEQRVNWSESMYHPLFNNSHYLVSWAKTGKEYPMVSIVKDLEYSGNVHPLDPTMMMVDISSLEDVKPSDHIVTKLKMSSTQFDHWLVQSIDVENNKYTAYTWSGDKVVKKQLKWEGGNRTFRIEYDPHTTLYTAEKAIENAETKIQESFSSSDEFVTTMKTGKGYLINKSCLFSTDNGPVSYTPVTADIGIDEGDHLVIKDDEGRFHSLLFYKCVGEGTIVMMPDMGSTALYGELDLAAFKEIYRINYRESLPIEAVLRRACSQTGENVLKSCGTDQFISWTKTGRMAPIDISKLQQESKPQVASVRPWEREKIVSIDEIKVGDHLIQPHTVRWFHFMVTECGTNPSDPYKVKVIYCFHGAISEKVIIVNPRNDNIHRINYPECLPADIAIQRARSRLGELQFSPIARMWFVRWAKTDSDEGIEVDFLTNNAVPVTKSRIMSFSQLNLGDYLVEKRQKLSRWHHYLVTEIHSPTHCCVIQSWGNTPIPDKATESQLTLSEGSIFYRINHNEGACVSAECAIATARKKVGKTFPTHSKYTRQKFVNRVKTREATIVSVDELLDDRLFLAREKVDSLSDLKPGDHIEYTVTEGEGESNFHHMLVVDIVNKEQCRVIYYSHSGMAHMFRKGSFQEEELDLFKDSPAVFRVSYPEMIPPHESIQLLRKAMDHATSAEGRNHILATVIGDPAISIQVGDKLHGIMQYKKVNVPKPITVALGCTTTKSTSRLLILSKISAKTAKHSSDGMEMGLKLGSLSSSLIEKLGVPGADDLFKASLFARRIYKLHRQKKFEQISENEYYEAVIPETFAAVNKIVGKVGGAIVGQIVIPVPVVGAAIGGAVGSVAGHAIGGVEGRAVAKLFCEKITTLPIVVKYLFTDIISL